FVVLDIEHGNNAVNADPSFLNAREERIAVQVVKAVHIELAGNQSMKELSGVAVSEYFERHVESASKLPVQFLHESVGNTLMVYAVQEGFFQGMGERPMTHVVQQDGQLSRFVFLFRYLDTPVSQGVQCTSH